MPLQLRAYVLSRNPPQHFTHSSGQRRLVGAPDLQVAGELLCPVLVRLTLSACECQATPLSPFKRKASLMGNMRTGSRPETELPTMSLFPMSLSWAEGTSSGHVFTFLSPHFCPPSNHVNATLSP